MQGAVVAIKELARMDWGTYSSIFNASPLLVWWEERAQARKAAAARTRTA